MNIFSRFTIQILHNITTLHCQFINNIYDNSCSVSTQHMVWGQRGEWRLVTTSRRTWQNVNRVHSHAPSIWSHRGTYRKWFSRFLTNESLRKTHLRLSMSFGKIPFLPFCKRTLRRMMGKDIRKTRHQISKFPMAICVTDLPAPSCFCLCFLCFWGEVSMSWILNDIGRNSLLGNGKKLAKFLKRTFTCRSTFLYGISCHTGAIAVKHVWLK